MKLILHIILLTSFCGSLISESFFDLSMFKSGNQPYVKISFYSDKLSVPHTLFNDKYIANIDFQIIINDLTLKKVDTLNWKFTSQFDTSKFSIQNVVIAENRLNLKADNDYIIVCNAIHLNKILTSQSLTVNTEINLKPCISDILFAFEISDSVNNIQEFKHSNYKVIPNASNSIYGIEPNLLTYQEFYNFEYYIGSYINIKYSILDGTKKEAFSQSKKLKVKFSEFLDNLDLLLLDLPTGTYYLSISVLDSNNKNIFTKNKLFYLLNPVTKPKIEGLFKESRAYEESVFASMTDEEIDIEFNNFKLILTEYEIDQYSKLIDYKAKKRAIYKFWHIRDTDTSTALNEKREEFLKRIEFAENLFSNGLENSGWKSERGKIVIKYGIPPIRNIYQSEGDRVECEEWLYDDLDGGLYFYFVQRFGITNFVLVHSNAKGEPRDQNWVQNYKPNIQSDGSSKFQDSNNRQR